MSDPQNMSALKLANARRLARAELRQRVRGARTFPARCVQLAEIFADGVPACLASMRMDEAFVWLSSLGVHWERFLDETLEVVGCTEFKLLGDLTLRQRSILVNELRAAAGERQAA